ncbi:methylated-DNA--[protein]-cysteine S-methyltransferase [Paludibacteraceae bacterium OttesenSCG-928-F17]|nr:methylated-DNA--[protein]-cysteine S-methyltransferase [Paludibacteraceae bacterium OttesenSCG-928-F17]
MRIMTENFKKRSIAGVNRKIVLDRMIDHLPQKPWADIEISDWTSGDDNLLIEYAFYDSSFGEVLVANTPKGICYLGLSEGQHEDVLTDFKKRFNYTQPIEKESSLQKQAVEFLNGKSEMYLCFHLKGTSYQTGIWRKLIRIPYGNVISYATLGGSAEYSRAAGTANGRNPVFWIIPCHRAVKTTGGFDRYFWGENIKKQLLAWEFANSSI